MSLFYVGDDGKVHETDNFAISFDGGETYIQSVNGKMPAPSHPVFRGIIEAEQDLLHRYRSGEFA